MPRSRSRGGTRMPRAGDDTTCPAMLISPAGTAKLTPSIAGRPTENCLRRSVTSSVAVMISMSSWMQRSLPIAESLVPVGNPWPMQLYVLVEFREPDFYDPGIEAFGIDRRHFQRSEVAELLDHEGLALFRQAPVEEQLCGVGMGGGLGNSRSIGIDRRALGREEDL